VGTAAIFGLAVAIVLGQVWFLAELKRQSPTTWRALSSPSWLRPLSSPALRFIQRRRYQSLSSPRLRALGAALRIGQLLLALAFVLGLGYSLTSLWQP
jgi:hypothetical protein